MGEGQTAMLGLEELRESWCLEVSVVRITPGRRKRYRVRAAFTEPCHDPLDSAAGAAVPRADRVDVAPRHGVHDEAACTPARRLVQALVIRRGLSFSGRTADRVPG